MIAVTINGSAQMFDHALSIAELIQQMKLAGKRIAIERNGEIVPRSQYAQQMLVSGDKLEIVVAVGGG
ncbi:MAG: sulfur carrier protein ThiS [Gallionellaceae bacterium]